jgi:Right handed beta helix region
MRILSSSRSGRVRAARPAGVLPRGVIGSSLPLLFAGAMVAALLAVPGNPAGAASTGPVHPSRAVSTAAATDSTDLYVDSAASAHCSDSGSGTQTQPFCDIAAAQAVVQPGQTVIVEPGDYAGTTISVSGTASAPITFLAANEPSHAATVDSEFMVSGAHDVVISGFVVTADQPFLVEGSSDITINGGAAVATGVGDPAIEVTGTSSSVTISRVSVTPVHDTGVQIDQGATGAVVTTNTINGGPGPGVLVTGAPGTDVVSNTVVTGCRTGIMVAGTSPGTYLENNIVETGGNPSTAKACTTPADAIAFSVSAASTSGTVADYNLIDPISGGPLYDWGATSYSSLASFTAATGQGAQDLAASPGLGQEAVAFGSVNWFPVTATSPAIDSANANAPGELATDQLANPRADDPAVANTGTGPGYYDRGAVELEGGLIFGQLSVQPNPAGGPLAVTASAPITSSWTTNGPSGTYEFIFDGAPLPIVTTGSGTGYAFATAGEKSVLVVESAGDTFAGVTTLDENADVVVGADYTPVTPTRILDTRSGIGAAKGAIAAGGDLTLPISSVGGVSAADISAIVANVTVIGPTEGGSLTVYSQSGAGAATSSINFSAGQTIANLVTVQPAGGVIRFQNNSKGTVQVVADLDGYYGGGEYGFQPMTPVRVLDTRNGAGTTAAGAVAARGTLRLNLSGKVPAGAAAAVLNLTATQPTAGGFITAYAGGQPVPDTSNLNFTAGKTVANQVIVPLTSDVADFYNDSGGTVQLIADLDGYYSSGATSSFVPYGPTRIVDTRVGLGAKAGAVPAHGTLVITPSTFSTGCNPNATCTTFPSAFVLNVTVTQPKAGGVLIVYPDNGSPPGTSSVNFSAGQTVANLVTVEPFNSDIAIYNQSSGSVQIVVDEQGYYIAPP